MCMYVRILAVILIPLFLSFGSPADPGLIYIEKHLELAIQEHQRSGIPVSIKLAQAIIESGNGKSILASRE